MRKIFTALLVCVGTYSTLFAQYKYEELLFMPWGEGEKEAGFRKSPGGQFGPMSFVVDDGARIIVLDTQNRSVKIFEADGVRLSRNIPIKSQTIDDIIWDGEEHYYLLDANVVSEYMNGIKIGSYSTDSPRRVITALSSDTEGGAIFIVNGSSTFIPDPTNPGSIITRDGLPITNSSGRINVIRRNSRTASVIFEGRGSFDIKTENLGTVRYIGSMPHNYHYIYIEIIDQPIPLKVSRRIELYDENGTVKARFEMPVLTHSYIFREFFVDKQGNLYKMVSTKEGVHIISWQLEPNSRFPRDVLRFDIPEKFRGSYHYNRIEEPEPEIQKPSEKDGVFIFPTVTPAEALAIAETYVDHVYTVGSNNLTYGLILDPDGVEVQTPPWVQPGTVTPVVYQWGGFFTLGGFDAGLAGGKYAGDKATSGVSAYAVGVDCSGFVSRCWKLPIHYSTRMMDDEITIAYSSWDQMGPGDAIHKPGHVRLLVEKNPDGSLLAVESAGYNWRVWHRSYILSNLVGYTPRYYINMEGSPGNFPRPELAYVASRGNPEIGWRDLSNTEALGIRIYMNAEGNTWTDPLNGGLIGTNVNSINMDFGEPPPLFFNLHTISPLDSVTESLPSDAYGFHSSNNPEKILLVDGFDRYGGSGSYAYPYHSFARTLGLALAPYDYSFDTANNDAVVDSLVSLGDYDVVFWSLGDESTVDETFSLTEQELVMDYLRQGGKLFVSGSEIAWDLDYRGNQSDKNFIQDYLKAVYKLDNSQSYTVAGAPGSVFEGLDLHFDDGSHGVYMEDYPDVFTANGSESTLLYESGEIAALTFEGNVPGGSQPAQTMIMGFPFETIYDESERVQLIGRVLLFFGFDVQTDVAYPGIDHQLPLAFSLAQNFPNPFNAKTRIRFSLAVETEVKLIVFDLLGKEVERLVEGDLPRGDHSVIWDASDFATGVYFFRFQAGSPSDGLVRTRKMLLLK